MNNEIINQKLKALNRDGQIQNLIAQAHARYILLITSENEETFPKYTISDDKLDLLAFHYLNLGCLLAENQMFGDAIDPIEKGAALLEAVHSVESNKKSFSNYYGLVAALAYYVAFQYSKSYILIRKLESNTIISRYIALFLTRDFKSLENEIHSLLVNENYEDTSLAQSDESIENRNSRIYEITIAKALSGYVQYFYTGNKDILARSKYLLRSLKEITEIGNEPEIWWVIRLLLLIADGFEEASLWNALSGYFDTEDSRIKKYIKSLVFSRPRGIYELFLTQRKSLDKVLNNDSGCVVSIPTSSGKTRIAEIAILNCLTRDSSGKVLYIAPFRSLAFEVENTLEPILGNIGIAVSHLYGGGLYSSLDKEVVMDSGVIIATPEKAKAMMRGNSELLEEIKLVIIDEGHLLGADERLIVNEIFYEELRFHMENNGGKFLLLSAVLPNSEELATWLTNSATTVYKDAWRPSNERLGTLVWTGTQVDINWVSQDLERESFNKKFIISEKLPKKSRERKDKFFPGNKNEAVALATYKLRNFGSALIFVGLKDSVFVMARAYLKCLGDLPEDHNWKHQHDWRAFELACNETYGENNNWLKYARKGILCHNADLHTDVRLPLERLMRNDKPLVVIATSTLGQGVNLGVSTVVFSTLYQAGELINARDFWNIAGRAGRAFVDHEGKILVALDATQEPKKIRKENRKISAFFDKNKIDIATSGILFLINLLKQLADKINISFDLLIQLIAENNLKSVSTAGANIDSALDLIDDTLLSILHKNNKTSLEIDFSWVESFFRKSLAAIQAENPKQLVDQDEVVSFFNARLIGIVKKVGNDRSKWDSHTKSGIPLNSDLLLEERLLYFEELVIEFWLDGSNSVYDKVALLAKIEKQLIDLPVLSEEKELLEIETVNNIRTLWILGVPVSEIIRIDGNVLNIIAKVYTFKLPWILNAIAQKLRNIESETADIIEELALMVESGLPSLKDIKIYQAGIRSRSAARKIGEIISEGYAEGMGIMACRKDLIRNKDIYKSLTDQYTGEWLELLANNSQKNSHKIEPIYSFSFGNVHKETNILLPKKINGAQYLVDPISQKCINIDPCKIDFSEVNDLVGIYFKYNEDSKLWDLIVENPYVSINEDWPFSLYGL